MIEETVIEIEQPIQRAGDPPEPTVLHHVAPACAPCAFHLMEHRVVLGTDEDEVIKRKRLVDLE